MSRMSDLDVAIEEWRASMGWMLDDDLSDAVDEACEEICEDFGITDHTMIQQVWGRLYE